jgi:hypothetical protein
MFEITNENVVVFSNLALFFIHFFLKQKRRWDAFPPAQLEVITLLSMLNLTQAKQTSIAFYLQKYHNGFFFFDTIQY